MKDFRDNDLVIGKLPHMTDVLVDEQAWANGFVEALTCPNGEKTVLACPPIHLNYYTKDPATPAPALGAHTDEVLRSFGYDEHTIRQMHSVGAVK